MKKDFYWFPLLVVILVGCTSTESLQDGRSLSKGVSEFSSTINVGNFNDVSGAWPADTIVPDVKVQYGYGLSNRFDLGIKVNSAFFGSIQTKYQLIGTQNSMGAVSIFNEIGVNSATVFLGRFDYYNLTSIIGSIHLKKFAIFTTPKFLFQDFQLREWPGKMPDEPIQREIKKPFGLSYGVIYGSKHRFGLEFSHYFNKKQNSLQVGLMYSYRF